MNIDVHHHCITQGYFDAVRRDPGAYVASIVTVEGGDQAIRYESGLTMVMRRPHWDVSQRLADMDAARLDVGCLSALPITLFYWMDPEMGERNSRAINDGIAAVVEAHPNRFVGLADVPLQAPERAIRELERAVKELGFPGVQLGTHIHGRNLDEPDFFPFFARAAELGALIFIHAISPAGSERLSRYYLRNFIGNPLEDAIALASLIFGGVLERLPDLRVCIAHGGGVGPALRGRWRHGSQVRPESRLLRPFDELYGRVYFDTLTHDAASLRFLISEVGSRRVVIGTDYPADMGNMEQVAMVEGLGLPQADTRRILEENAAALGLKPRA